eukprot:CAMPEP_0118939068 /NCGR_PEP_ID=MMETSP1169-20130426/27860_1 /TAXON_ID=36882 /ORGANISM="Pyramimonas obovata, Strain CCMP722" /LENGTH=144 /DNA_ID=CAMNT_0006883245 /DNA_START=164 /DNA_END=595 /DNA_ORIENTATION=+
MASEFGAIRKLERDQLLSRLVTHLTDCEPPDENFGIALEYCLYHTQYHKFLDSSPQETQRLYNGLFEKLRVRGQLGKAKAVQSLANLGAQLVEKNISEGRDRSSLMADRPARVLHLLYACSEAPLSSTYDSQHVARVVEAATRS